jgi:hypothetical protein
MKTQVKHASTAEIMGICTTFIKELSDVTNCTEQVAWVLGLLCRTYFEYIAETSGTNSAMLRLLPWFMADSMPKCMHDSGSAKCQ